MLGVPWIFFLYPTLIVFLPFLFGWSWFIWFRHKDRHSLRLNLSSMALMLASGSALSAASSVAFAAYVRPLTYYDPVLMKVYAIGILTAAIGVLCAVCGAFKKTPLRWYALVLNTGMLVFWFFSMSLE